MTSLKDMRFNRLPIGFIFLLMVGLFALMLFWNNIVVNVPAGQAGVMWYRFFGGTEISSPPKREGLHLIFPWDNLQFYNLRLQRTDQSLTALTSDGLAVKLDISVRHTLYAPNLGVLSKTVGPDYVKTLLEPSINAVANEVVSKYRLDSLLSDERLAVQKEVLTRVASMFGVGSRENHMAKDLVLIEDLMITNVTLPEKIKKAVENKLEQEQVAGEYKYRVEREKLESERKVIEAQGIRKFQDIVTPAISNNYLKWRGIEHTSKLAESPNSKVVIIGSGPGGLPVILDGLGKDTAAKPQ